MSGLFGRGARLRRIERALRTRNSDVITVIVPDAPELPPSGHSLADVRRWLDAGGWLDLMRTKSITAGRRAEIEAALAAAHASGCFVIFNDADMATG